MSSVLTAISRITVLANAKRLGGAVVVVLLGLWLGSPPTSERTGFDDSDDLSSGLTSGIRDNGSDPVALQSLYERQVWSIPDPGAGAREDGEQADSYEPPPPEGLDRYMLVGIIRVESAPAEALLLDLSIGETEKVIRRTEGSTLGEDKVHLERIAKSSVTLSLAGEQRTLELFPRPEILNDNELEDDSTSNET